MILTRLEIVNFRNYPKAEVDFRTGTNVLYGKNGQGKTNILESIFYLALTKSFRTNRDQNLILSDTAYFRIQGEFTTAQGRRHTCSMAYSPTNGKRLTLNGERIQRFTDYIGTVPLVLLAPSDLATSQQGPQKRRQFLNLMLSQSSRLYLHHLLEYKRALKQRNSLLQQERPDENLLISWEDALIQNGMVLIEKRREAAAVLSDEVKSYYQQLSGSGEKTKIIYQSSFHFSGEENIEEAYREAFRQNRSKDLVLGTTTVGPHRDDLLFLINGKPLRTVGSQGEHKTFVIALKMAEFNYVRRMQKEPPILLFDDIFGELDAERITNMIRSLSDIGQVFITTTSAKFFDKLNTWSGETSFYQIIEGTVNPGAVQ